jgi:hypothetical protein
VLKTKTAQQACDAHKSLTGLSVILIAVLVHVGVQMMSHV